MAAIRTWRALTLDGEWLEKPAALARGLAQLRAVVVELEGGATIQLECDPTRGEQLLVFTRHRRSTNLPSASMPVLEIRNDPERPDRFVRLYLHPVKGLVLSTREEQC